LFSENKILHTSFLLCYSGFSLGRALQIRRLSRLPKGSNLRRASGGAFLLCANKRHLFLQIPLKYREKMATAFCGGFKELQRGNWQNLKGSDCGA
jgi:hypothetical protein